MQRTRNKRRFKQNFRTTKRKYTYGGVKITLPEDLRLKLQKRLVDKRKREAEEEEQKVRLQQSLAEQLVSSSLADLSQEPPRVSIPRSLLWWLKPTRAEEARMNAEAEAAEERRKAEAAALQAKNAKETAETEAKNKAKAEKREREKERERVQKEEKRIAKEIAYEKSKESRLKAKLQEEQTKIAAAKARLEEEKAKEERLAKRMEESKRMEEEEKAKKAAEKAEADMIKRAEKKATRAIQKMVKSLDTPIESPYYDKQFWLQFFTEEELNTPVEPDDTIARMFYIPAPNTILLNAKNGFRPVSSDELNTIQTILKKLFVIYGRISFVFQNAKFPYKLIWKGTRALGLATGKLFKTTDIDIGIVADNEDISLEDYERIGPDIANNDLRLKYTRQMNLGLHIAGLTNHLLGVNLSILTPSSSIVSNKKLVKSSLVFPECAPFALVDNGFIQTTKIREQRLHSQSYEFRGVHNTLYLYPVVSDMFREKELYLEHYNRDPVNNAFIIQHLRDGIDNIKCALDPRDCKKTEASEIVERAKAEKAELEKRQQAVASNKLTKEQLQALITEKMQRQKNK